MNLQDYLELKKRAKVEDEAQRQLEASSPENILEAVQANTDHTSDLIGQRVVEARSQTRSVLDSLGDIAEKVVDSKKAEPVKQPVFTIKKEDSGKIVNTTLIEIRNELRNLTKTNEKIEKYLRPDPNSKDDTYAKRKEAAAGVAKEKWKGKDPASSDNPLVALAGLAGGWAYKKIKDIFKDPSKLPPEAGGTAGGTATGGAAKIPPEGAVKVPPVEESRSYKAGKYLGEKFTQAKSAMGDLKVGASEAYTKYSPKVQSFVERAYEATKNTAIKAKDITVGAAEKYAPKLAEAVTGAKDSVKPVISKMADYALRAKEAATPIAEKALEATKTAATKSVEYAGRAKEALTPVAEKAWQGTKAATSTVLEKGGEALSKVKQVGGDLLGKFKAPTAEVSQLAGGATGAAEAVAEGGSKGLWQTAKTGLKSAGRAAATWAAPALAAYDTYDIETNDKLNRDEKNVKHGGTAGGLAGAWAGMTAGAAAGSVVGGIGGTAIPVPVLGTLTGAGIGGVIGGIGGGILGYMGGSSIGENAVEGYQKKRDINKVKELDSAKAKAETEAALPKTQIAALATQAKSDADAVQQKLEEKSSLQSGTVAGALGAVGLVGAIGSKAGSVVGGVSATPTTSLESNSAKAALALSVAAVSDSATMTAHRLDNVGQTFQSSTKELGNKLEDTTEKFSFTFDGFTKKFSEMFDGAKDKLGSAVSSVGSMAGRAMGYAGEKAASGAQAMGSGLESFTKGTRFEGAGKSAAGMISSAGEIAGMALSKSGTSVAMKSGEVGYNLQKGSASTLDLAKGYQGTSTLKGLTDAQTKAYAGDVMKTESGGKLGIQNQYGYVGQYQFGAEALASTGLVDEKKLKSAKADAKAQGKSWYDPVTGGAHKEFLGNSANWKVEGGIETFKNDKKMQDEAFGKYTNNNIDAGYKSGVLNANSKPEDIAAYAKMSHLVGAGASNKYFKTGEDKSDANKTKGSVYAAQGANSLALASKLDGTDSKLASVKSLPTEVSSTTESIKVASAEPNKLAYEEATISDAGVSSYVSKRSKGIAQSPTATLGIRGLATDQVAALSGTPFMGASLPPGVSDTYEPSEMASTSRSMPRMSVAAYAPTSVAGSSDYNIPQRASTQRAYGSGQMGGYSDRSLLPIGEAIRMSGVQLPPGLMPLLQDPSVAKMAASGDLSGLASHPSVINAAGSMIGSKLGIPSMPQMPGMQSQYPSMQQPYSRQPQYPSMQQAAYGMQPQSGVSSLVSSMLGVKPQQQDTSYNSARYGQLPNQMLNSSRGMDYQPASVSSYRSSPQPTLSSNVAEESQNVAISNFDSMPMSSQQSTGGAAGGSSGLFDTAVPKLDNIPLQISDMGLVLLNVGHI